jgi:lipopolysaccharide/colanic/teichoic acid biosynthesis glycosyltransferase
MSLVGPRPITRDEAGYYGDKFAHYLSCRPGITGAWQVSGRSDTSYDQRVDLDATYAAGQSLMTDIDILFRTAKVVLERTGAK